MGLTALRDSRFRLSAEQARDLASTYGTPLYVLDEAHFRGRIARYQAAFQASWPETSLAYASKANSTLAVLRTAWEEGCLIDVASEGELRAALKAGVPALRCHLHGNNKAGTELEFAVSQGIGAIVADNDHEIEVLGALAGKTEILLRLSPGVDPRTHAKISTGQADTKFGFNIADGSAERALRRSIELCLNVVGFHCHVGSQLLDPGAQQAGGELLGRFAAEMKESIGFSAQAINVGGGLGIRYADTDSEPDVEAYCAGIAENVRAGLGASGLTPSLGQEPGRWLIGESGITLYTVGAIKSVPIAENRMRTYVAVDGGLADNPRPALYGARYTVERVGGSSVTERTFTVSGRHCETDLLFPDVLLPDDLAVGDVLQVLCTGAYNASMASNYNRYPRPATAWIRPDGTHALVQRRETYDEMLARESLP
jgi:diaminopimelate decarboxylase